MPYELAYKFGFAASGPQAMALYQKLMARTPDDPVANFQYGSFLAENDTLRPQSVPYLEKAVSLGMKKANYTLGITYIAMGQNEKGLGYLQQYSTDYPNDLQAKSLIAAVKSGAIKSPRIPDLDRPQGRNPASRGLSYIKPHRAGGSHALTATDSSPRKAEFPPGISYTLDPEAQYSRASGRFQR